MRETEENYYNVFLYKIYLATHSLSDIWLGLIYWQGMIIAANGSPHYF